MRLANALFAAIVAGLFTVLLLREAPGQTLEPPTTAYLIVCPACPGDGSAVVVEWSLDRGTCVAEADELNRDGIWARCSPSDAAIERRIQAQLQEICRMRADRGESTFDECVASLAPPSE